MKIVRDKERKLRELKIKRTMLIEVLKSKIHRVQVTEADLNYMGSITIDEDLMDEVNLIENEKVHVLNLSNGERIETYVISGTRGSEVIAINGAAARLFSVGDMVIILSFAQMDFENAKNFKPEIIVFNDNKTYYKI